MRLMITALFVLPIAMLAGISASKGAEERCTAVRDSAICAGRSDCYYDVNGKGCLAGQRPAEDACASHGSKSVCELDVSLGCKWDDASSACATKTE
jgi:hypothetical protein